MTKQATPEAQRIKLQDDWDTPQDIKELEGLLKNVRHAAVRQALLADIAPFEAKLERARRTSRGPWAKYDAFLSDRRSDGVDLAGRILFPFRTRAPPCVCVLFSPAHRALFRPSLMYSHPTPVPRFSPVLPCHPLPIHTFSPC